MADDAAPSADESYLTFQVKAANDKKLTVTVRANSTVAELKATLASPDQADVPPERQRLIYSGRVLKDADTLASYKIQDGHTVHLVKGAASNARQNAASQGAASTPSGSGTPAPQVPTNLATGVGNNPLAGLTGARYAGFHGLPGADMFGPDGGMGPPPDSAQLLQMMEDPNFLSQMNEAMNNPQVIEMMTQNPMVRNNPMLAEIIRNPEMRRMMFNPEMMRMQLEMQRSMNPGGQRMAAPGVTDTTPQPNSEGGATQSNQQNTTGAAQQPAQAQDPLASLFGRAGGAGAGAGANPFASLFGTQGAGAFGSPSPQNQNNTGTTSPPPNPFSMFGQPRAGADGQQQPNPLADLTRQMMQNPEAMQAALNMLGGGGGFGGAGGAGNTGASPPGGAAANPFASLFGPGFGAGGFGSPPPPADTRPPEEVYEAQLRQLNEMGFYEFDRNVAALRRSGGNVQGAIEHLLGGGS